MKISLEHSAHNLNIVENESGLVIDLENLEGKKVATIAYSNYSDSIIHVVDYTQKEPEYACQDCGSEYTAEDAGEYCRGCGGDCVFLIEDEDGEDE